MSRIELYLAQGYVLELWKAEGRGKYCCLASRGDTDMPQAHGEGTTARMASNNAIRNYKAQVGHEDNE